MRHKIYGKQLGRDKNQRTALFKNLVQALLIHGSIQTTEAKAKAIKGMVDKIINQAKNKNTQRLLQSFFIQKEIREKLIKEIAPNLGDRQSGYTSLVRLGNRSGDGAMMVRMSLLVSEKGKVQSEKSANTSEVESEVKSESDTSEVSTRKAKKPSKRAKTAKTASKKGANKKS